MTTTSTKIKGAVANAVFTGLERIVHEKLANDADPVIAGSAVEVHRVSDLQMQVRVKTQQQGSHWFLVRVSEQV